MNITLKHYKEINGVMKRLYKSKEDKVLAGICGGVAEYFQVDPTLVRIIWLFLTLFGGSGVLAYVIGMIIIPRSPDHLVTRTKKETSQVHWGIALVIVGVILFAANLPILHTIWNRFWGSLGNGFLAIVFLIFIVWFFNSRKSDIFRKMGSTDFSSLHLSLNDRKVAGVCGGIGEALDMDSTLVRFFGIFGTIMTSGLGILLYGILALILPTFTAEE